MNKQKIAELLTEYKWKDIPLDDIIRNLEPLYIEDKDDDAFFTKGDRVYKFEDLELKSVYVVYYEGCIYTIKVTSFYNLVGTNYCSCKVLNEFLSPAIIRTLHFRGDFFNLSSDSFNVPDLSVYKAISNGVT